MTMIEPMAKYDREIWDLKNEMLQPSTQLTMANANVPTPSSRGNEDFVAESRLKVTLMKEALSFNDWETLASLAHHLSLSFDRRGLLDLGSLCHTLEHCASSSPNLALVPSYIRALSFYVEGMNSKYHH